jgi:hypothetical protein
MSTFKKQIFKTAIKLPCTEYEITLNDLTKTVNVVMIGCNGLEFTVVLNAGNTMIRQCLYEIVTTSPYISLAITPTEC